MQAFLLSRVVDSLLCELFRLSDFGGALIIECTAMPYHSEKPQLPAAACNC